MIEQAKVELQARRRHKNVTLQSLYADIKKLLTISFPGVDLHSIQGIVVDAFLAVLAP